MSRSGGSPLRLEVMTSMVGPFKVIKRQSDVAGVGVLTALIIVTLVFQLSFEGPKDRLHSISD